MRYSEFDDLRQRLVSSFPHARSALPALPPKSVLCMAYLGSMQNDSADGHRQIQTQVPGKSACWSGVFSQVGIPQLQKWSSANDLHQLCPTQPGVLRFTHRQGLSFRSNVLNHYEHLALPLQVYVTYHESDDHIVIMLCFQDRQ